MANQSWASRFNFTQFAAPAIAGQAIFTGCLAVVPIERRTLRARLPPSITLPQTDADECPSLLVFGEQAAGMTFFGGFPVPWGLQYHELMLAIPFVRCDRLPGDYLFVSGMVCDFWPAVWNGNTYYGFSKRFAPMSWDGVQFFVKDDAGQVDFRGALGAAGRTAGEAFEWIRSAAALPVLGLRGDGVVVRTRFEWDFRASTIERTGLYLTVDEGFEELPLGSTSFSDGCAYRVEGMQWRLGWPDAVRANRP